MNVRISLHPASALIGALALGFVLLLASAASHSPDRPIEVYGIPKAANILRLTAADLPYTVPATKSLVITGWVARTTATGNAGLLLRIDGSDVVFVTCDDGGIMGSARVFSPGIVATAGSLVANAYPSPSGSDGVILGYLAPQ